MYLLQDIFRSDARNESVAVTSTSSLTLISCHMKAHGTMAVSFRDSLLSSTVHGDAWLALCSRQFMSREKVRRSHCMNSTASMDVVGKIKLEFYIPAGHLPVRPNCDTELPHVFTLRKYEIPSGLRSVHIMSHCFYEDL